MRRALRALSTILIVAGVLLIADAGLTLAWQEPISAFLAAQEQSHLGHVLDSEVKSFLPREKLLVASIRDTRLRLAKLAQIERHRAKAGAPIGRIHLPSIGRKYVVVQGTGVDTLRKGPGHYPNTSFPGEHGTVAIAGHVCLVTSS